MSREIDRLAVPDKPKDVKVFVASASRTGTLGLYTALKMLGYKPYHMMELCLEGGVPHMKMATEAIIAQHNRFSGIKKYREEEFKKWFANYDCLVEVPSFFGTEVLEAYANDPSIKFILTERDPDKWAISVNNSAGMVSNASNSFPLKYLKHFNTTLYSFLTLGETIYAACADSTVPGDPDNHELLKNNYISYINAAKRIIPKDQLCHIRLEDGLGWEQICPFLGVPIPDEPYPRGNEPEKFKAIMADFIDPLVQDAMIKMGSVTAALLGIAGWAAWKYFSVQDL